MGPKLGLIVQQLRLLTWVPHLVLSPGQRMQRSVSFRLSQKLSKPKINPGATAETHAPGSSGQVVPGSRPLGRIKVKAPVTQAAKC